MLSAYFDFAVTVNIVVNCFFCHAKRTLRVYVRKKESYPMKFDSQKESYKPRALAGAHTVTVLYFFKSCQSASEVGTIPGEEKLYAIAK